MGTDRQAKIRRAQQATRREPALAMGVTAKLFRSVASNENSPQAAQRYALARMLRAIDVHAVDPVASPITTSSQTCSTAIPPEIKLSRRLRQTLDRLLVGDSEKQIAANLQVSRHTVHVYVKSLYRQFEVNSRGELLAKFIRSSSSG